MRENTQLVWPFVRLPKAVLERAKKEAKRRGLVPLETRKGQDANKLGVAALFEMLLSQAEAESIAQDIDTRFPQEEL